MTPAVINGTFLSVAVILSAAGATLLNTSTGFWNGIVCLMLAVGVIYLREKVKK